MTTYASYYYSSNGQPRNGYNEHTSKREAIASARVMARQNLILNSGGRAVAVRLDLSPDGEEFHEEPIYMWIEHIEGGYRAI